MLMIIYTCLYVFIKQSEYGIVIVAVYINDLILKRTPEELQKTADCLKNEFKMKDLRKIRYCLELQTECKLNGIFSIRKLILRKFRNVLIYKNLTY